MLRTALCTTLAALGLAVTGPDAAAQSYFPSTRPQTMPSYSPGYPVPLPIPAPPQRRFYEVEFRTNSRQPWRTLTVTLNRDRAYDLARYLRWQGYQARVDWNGCD